MIRLSCCSCWTSNGAASPQRLLPAVSYHHQRGAPDRPAGRHLVAAATTQRVQVSRAHAEINSIAHELVTEPWEGRLANGAVTELRALDILDAQRVHRADIDQHGSSAGGAFASARRCDQPGRARRSRGWLGPLTVTQAPATAWSSAQHAGSSRKRALRRTTPQPELGPTGAVSEVNN